MEKRPFLNYAQEHSLLLPADHPFTPASLHEAFCMTFANNEHINHAGTSMHYLFLILSGTAKILKTEANGRQLILHFLHASDYVGDLTLVKAESDTKDVVAIGEVVCLAMPMAYAQNVLAQDITFLTALSRYIGVKLVGRVEHYALNQTFELKYRLAHLLLEVSVDDYYQQKHTEIAEYLGVSYRHLLQNFSDFKQLGYITKSGKGFTINRQLLMQFLAQVKPTI